MISLKINNAVDRNSVATSLINNGYVVLVYKVQTETYLQFDHYIGILEENDNIKQLLVKIKENKNVIL